jgi:transcription termination factor Rho
MDDMIYEEFKGTGNMELHLVNRFLNCHNVSNSDLLINNSSLRVELLPISIAGKIRSTRKEELLISKSELDTLWQLRNLFTDSTDFTERFIRKLKKSKNNEDFFKI